MQTGNAATRRHHALVLVVVALALVLAAPRAAAQSALTVRVPPGETREARLTINSNTTARLRTEPPAGLTVSFDPAEGGPGSWVTTMRVSADDGTSGEFTLLVTLDSGAATPATLDLTIIVAPIPTTTSPTTTVPVPATSATTTATTAAPPPTTVVVSSTTLPGTTSAPTTLAATATSIGTGGGSPGTSFAAPGSGGPGFGVVTLLAGIGLLAAGFAVAGLAALVTGRLPRRPHVSRVVFSSRYKASQPIGFNSPAPPPSEGTTPGDR